MFGLSSDPWIGGRRDLENRVSWRWSDGTAWDYTNWAPGAPNDAGGVEDCARLFENSDRGQWNDRVCSNMRTFVCKKPEKKANNTIDKPPSIDMQCTLLFGVNYVKGCRNHW